MGRIRKIKQVLRNLDDHGASAVDTQNLTFAELAAHFEQHYLTHPHQF